MNIVLLGAPGAGKGTQATRMVQEFGLPHISTGDIFRAAVSEGTPLGLEAKRYMDAGELVPDEVVIGIVKDRLNQADARDGFILDGFPRTAGQAAALESALSETGRSLDAVISIDVGREELIKRLTARRQCRDCGRIYNVLTDRPAENDKCDDCGGEVYLRDDDTVETVSNRLDVYEKNTAPLIAYYGAKGLLRPVDGAKPADEVWNQVRGILGR